jgi:hypothetical protein
MKRKTIFSMMILLFFLLFASGGWLPSDIRLDTGDPPGASYSSAPQISSSGSNVYAVWKDNRNGPSDIYFNYSTDLGENWQATDIRLDTGDTPGASYSNAPQISSSGNNVYVVWEDDRTAYTMYDIYFNYSTDGGATWQASDIRLDTGDPPGANYSFDPQISSSGSNVYVVWQDDRNLADIYFNYSTDGGATWQASDIQIDTGDPPGVSLYPQISSSGNNVYVVWSDYRNGSSDIYFNYSIDGGATWQASDIRLDTGDPPGTGYSWSPKISSDGSNVYVTWMDMRNGNYDIYFNYSADGGATWQASDIRLDTGDPPGAYGSQYPGITSSGDKVYVAWHDSRNGAWDIYFNCSADGGATWLASDIRLDIGDSPGANWSDTPQLSCKGSKVYVVWNDDRNGMSDIYFNCSTDGGMRWKTLDVRLDTGDYPGASDSIGPQIACSENNIFVVWYDKRNGEADIYFNTASIPMPDIKANGSDGPITITRSDTLSITVEFNSGFLSRNEADWWLVARTPLGWYYYHLASGWLPGREVTLQIPLRDLPLSEVLNMSGLPTGSYTFYFGVDLVKNGKINMGQAYYDSVEVTINP